MVSPLPSHFHFSDHHRGWRRMGALQVPRFTSSRAALPLASCMMGLCLKFIFKKDFAAKNKISECSVSSLSDRQQGHRPLQGAVVDSCCLSVHTTPKVAFCSQACTPDQNSSAVSSLLRSRSWICARSQIEQKDLHTLEVCQC